MCRENRELSPGTLLILLIPALLVPALLLLLVSSDKAKILKIASSLQLQQQHPDPDDNNKDTASTMSNDEPQ